MTKIFEISEQVLVKKKYYIQAESAAAAMNYFKTRVVDAHEEIREQVSAIVNEVKVAEEK